MAAIPSVPAAFTNPGDGQTNVTFAIPVGTYTTGTWRMVGFRGSAGATSDAIGVGASYVDTASFATAYQNFDLSTAVTPAQIADINAVAGGTLNALLSNGGHGAESISLLTLTLVGVTPPTYPRNLLYQPEEWLPEAGVWWARVGPRVVPMQPRGILVAPEEWLPEWQGVTRPLMRYVPPAPYGVVTIVGSLPFPGNCSAQQFVTVTYPYGYARVTIDAGLGATFDSPRPRGNALAVIRGSVLILTDFSGVELALNAACPAVDIWRFRYG